MRVVCCGVRGSTPAPGSRFARVGGHTSCLAVGHDGAVPSLLIDAGTGVRACSALLGGAPFDGTIVLGHLHWDHVQGLPFFAAADREDARVRVLVPRPTATEGSMAASAAELLGRFLGPPWFPVTVAELRGQWTVDWLDEGTTHVEGFTLTARQIPHGGGRTMGVRVTSPQGASLAYLSDHAPHRLGPGADGAGELHEAAMTLAEGSDLLVHDAQFTTGELVEFAHYGHSCATYACRLAEAAGVGQLLLYHHHPERDDDAVMALTTEAAAHCRVPVAAATEGMVIEL